MTISHKPDALAVRRPSVTRYAANIFLRFAIAVVLASCSSRLETEAPANTDKTGGQGGIDSLPAGPVDCADDPNPLLGVFVDQALGCVLTEAPRRVVACQGEEEVSAGTYASSCVRHVASGEQFWVTSPYNPKLAPGWERCSELPSDPPPPCFARHCPANEFGQPGYPDSTCTEAQTRDLFQCGKPSSQWDVECCKRPTCETNADCADGEECREFVDEQYRYAWPLGERCDSGGLFSLWQGNMCAPVELPTNE